MTEKRQAAYVYDPYPMFLYRRHGKNCQSLLVNDPEEHEAIVNADGGDEWVESPAGLGFPPTAPSQAEAAQMASGRNPNSLDGMPQPVDTGITDLGDAPVPQDTDIPALVGDITDGAPVVAKPARARRPAPKAKARPKAKRAAPRKRSVA